MRRYPYAGDQLQHGSDSRPGRQRAAPAARRPDGRVGRVGAHRYDRGDGVERGGTGRRAIRAAHRGAAVCHQGLPDAASPGSAVRVSGTGRQARRRCSSTARCIPSACAPRRSLRTRRVAPELRRVLACSRVEGVNGQGEALYAALTNLQKAGLFNLFAKMSSFGFDEQRTIWSFVDSVFRVRADRVFVDVEPALRDLVKGAVATDRFREVSGTLAHAAARASAMPDRSRRPTSTATCSSPSSSASRRRSPSRWTPTSTTPPASGTRSRCCATG